MAISDGANSPYSLKALNHSTSSEASHNKDRPTQFPHIKMQKGRSHSVNSISYPQWAITDIEVWRRRVYNQLSKSSSESSPHLHPHEKISTLSKKQRKSGHSTSSQWLRILKLEEESCLFIECLACTESICHTRARCKIRSLRSRILGNFESYCK